MRDPKRIPELLQLMGLIWVNAPDTRLTQLVSNAAALAGYTGSARTCACGKDDIHCGDVYRVEDDQIVLGLKKLLDLQKINQGG